MKRRKKESSNKQFFCVFILLVIGYTKLPQKSAELISAQINAIWHPNHRPKAYHVDDKFAKTLVEYASNASINPKTNRKCIMTFMTTSGIHLDYGANIYCSLKAVGFKDSDLIFIALDHRAYETLRELNIPVLLYSSQAPNVMFTVFRLAIAEVLLEHNFEVIGADNDAVFLDHPDNIFLNDASVDWEVTPEADVMEITPLYRPALINCGFWKMYPSARTLRFLNRWITTCLATNEPDQETLCKWLENRKTGQWLSKYQYRFDLTDEILDHFTIRIIDPFVITLAHSIMTIKTRKKWTMASMARGITRPKIFHMAYYWPTRKPSCLGEKNLWFIDFPNSKTCKTPPPTGTQNFWNDAFDFNTSLPREYRGMGVANHAIHK